MRKKSAVNLRAVQKYYIATMQPYGAEGTQRIRRHHALRQGKGFETIEQYQNVSKAFDKVQTEAVSHAAQNEKPVVLLECLSNLMANECFEEGGTPDAVFSDCIQLYRQCRHLVIVTNEIFFRRLSVRQYDNGLYHTAGTVKYTACAGSRLCDRGGLFDSCILERGV